MFKAKWKKYNIHLTAYPSPPSKINTKIYNSNDPTSVEDSGGVFIIPSTIMENLKKADYVNMTKRKFKKRLAEPITDIKLKWCRTDVSNFIRNKRL